MLLLSSLETDPGMDALNAAAATLPMPMGGRLFMGLASVAVNGSLRFGAPGLTSEMLGALANWVGTHLIAQPGLARLKDATFLNIQSDGVIAGIYESEMLWAGVPYLPVPGTIEGTAALLNELAEGEDAWFWMSEAGSSGSPAATVVKVDDDPTGRAFRGQVRAIRGEGAAFSGVLRPLNEVRLAMTTTGNIEVGVRIVTSLLASNRQVLKRLEGARLVHMSGGRFVAARTISSGPDLSGLVKALDELADGAKGVFWFTTEAKDGSPMLVIAEEPGALKVAAKQVQGSNRGMRGQVRMTNKGWLEFRSRKPIDNFIDALAGFAVANHGSWSGLSRLKGARLTVRDENDDIISRHRNDDVWKSLQ